MVCNSLFSERDSCLLASGFRRSHSNPPSPPPPPTHGLSGGSSSSGRTPAPGPGTPPADTAPGCPPTRNLAGTRSPKPDWDCGNTRSNIDPCPNSLITPCGVDRNRSFDHRRIMFPRLIRNVPGMTGGANHSPGRQSDRQPRHIGPAKRGHEAVIGVRGGAERVLAHILLRRIMQETQIDVRLIGEERSEEVRRHPQGRGKARQHPVAHGGQGVEISHHVLAQSGQALRPLVAPPQRNGPPPHRDDRRRGRG